MKVLQEINCKQLKTGTVFLKLLREEMKFRDVGRI